MRRLGASVGLLGFLLLLLVGMGGSVAAQPPEHEWDRVHKGTDTFVDEVPCVGEATITINFNATFHVTEFEDGRVHVTGTSAGKFTADPTDPSLPTYTGNFSNWFGENDNGKIVNGTFTFNVHGKGSDGSRVQFSVVGHFVVDTTTDTVKVEFEKVRCH